MKEVCYWQKGKMNGPMEENRTSQNRASCAQTPLLLLHSIGPGKEGLFGKRL